MRVEVGAQEATLVIGDPPTVRRLRALAEQAGGALTGDGPLTGPFLDLHAAIRSAVEALETALHPAPGAPPTVRDRLRRRRRP